MAYDHEKTPLSECLKIEAALTSDVHSKARLDAWVEHAKLLERDARRYYFLRDADDVPVSFGKQFDEDCDSAMRGSAYDASRTHPQPVTPAGAQASEPDHDCSNPESPCFHPSHDEDDSKPVGADSVAAEHAAQMDWLTKVSGRAEEFSAGDHVVSMFSTENAMNAMLEKATQPAQASEKDRLAAMVEHGMAGVDWSKQPLHEADDSNPAKAVAWQFRVNAGGRWLEWVPCTENLFDEIVEFGENRRRPAQARAIYTHPQPVTPAGGEVEPVAWRVTSDDSTITCHAEATAQAQAFELRRGGYPATITPLYSHPPVADAALSNAYDVGWIECTNWAKRDDLVSDMGSPAYVEDRARNLAALNQRGGGV